MTSLRRSLSFASTRTGLLAAVAVLASACASEGDNDGDGSSSNGDATGSESGGEESGDSAGTGESGDTADTGAPTDCTDDPNACESGTTCYCVDKTGDGTMVMCSCEESCTSSDDCPTELPNCGCSPDDVKVCLSNQTCVGG